MSAVAAARVGDEIAHGFGVAAMIGGAILGAVIGAAIVAAAAVTAPLTIAIIVGGSIAVGALSMKQLVSGISTVFKLPEPTTGAVKKGSGNVFINGRPAARAGLDLTSPCSGMPLNHFPSSSDVVIADGSSTVIVNGYPIARLKDKIACGAHISSGSENVFIGGDTARMADVFDLEGWMETGFQLLAGAALIGAGALAAAAGIGALAIFGTVTVGMGAAFEGLGRLGDRFGAGYRDLFQGAAGLGLLFAGPRMARTKPSPGNVNYMEPNDKFFLGVSKRKDVDPNGFYDVIAHGSTKKIQVQTSKGPVLVDHRVAARLIKQAPGYQKGQPIRMLSCDTGKGAGSFAQNLSNKMGVPVEAPTELVWTYPNGQKFVAAGKYVPGANGQMNLVPDMSKPGNFHVLEPFKKP
jgi:uncharacterized Zn-binding protein involved in type VI secretion